MSELPFITKLVAPQVKAGLVERPGLLEKLNRGLDMRLQLVQAGAGFGKTTLLSSFFYGLRAPACWYTLDPSDSDSRTFFSYLLSGLENASPYLKEKLGAIKENRPNQAQGTSIPVGQLVTAIENSGIPKVVVILDDYHTIEDSPAGIEVLTPLIDRAPSCLHIVLASRTSPKVSSIPRLMARREMTQLGEDDLRLSRDETNELLEILWERSPESSEVEDIHSRSEGWPAGVVLTSISQTSSQPGAPVSDFMIGEILASQPEELQEFMLRTSIPDELTLDLCSHLTGGSDTRNQLIELERRNTFIVRISESNLRYHQLFREALRDTLRQKDPSLYDELNIQAGHYFSRNALPEQAINHFMEGDRADLAAELIERESESTIDKGHWHTMVRWIDMLPYDVLSDRPRLILQRSRCFLYRGDPSGAITYLNLAIKEFQQAGDVEDEILALTTRSRAYRFQGAHKLSLQDTRKAVRLARERNVPQELVASAHRHLGSAYAHAGRFKTAKRHFIKAVKLFEGSTERFETGFSNAALATLYTELSDVPKALVYYRKAYQIWQELGNYGELAETLNNMAVSFRDIGEGETAVRLAEEAIRYSRQSGYHRVEAMALITLGDSLILEGDYESAQEKFKEGVALAQQAKEA